jgi:hypothetical protein
MGKIFTTLSLPHRLHLMGRSLICVVGSSHSTVCLPQDGQKNRRCFPLVSSFCGLHCKSCNYYHLVFLSHLWRKDKTKNLHHNRIQRLNGTGSKAQAQIQLADQSVDFAAIWHALSTTDFGLLYTFFPSLSTLNA